MHVHLPTPPVTVLGHGSEIGLVRETGLVLVRHGPLTVTRLIQTRHGHGPSLDRERSGKMHGYLPRTCTTQPCLHGWEMHGRQPLPVLFLLVR